MKKSVENLKKMSAEKLKNTIEELEKRQESWKKLKNKVQKIWGESFGNWWKIIEKLEKLQIFIKKLKNYSRFVIYERKSCNYESCHQVEKKCRKVAENCKKLEKKY